MQRITTRANPSGLWTGAGNYTVGWAGLTGVWATDAALYNATADYYIDSGADFAAFTRIINANINYTFLNKNVFMTDNVDLSAHYWDMSGGRTNGPTNNFSGNFDGGGFAVFGMNVDFYAYSPTYVGYGTDFNEFGLFAGCYKATISNLSIVDSVIVVGNCAPSTPNGVGFLMGCNSGTDVTNVHVINAAFSQSPNYGQGVAVGFFVGGIAGASYNEYTRNVPLNLPNTYTACSVSGLTMAYTVPIDQNWTYILSFGGIVGGDCPYGPSKTSVFQARITDCTVDDFSVTRGDLDVSYMYECYAGLMGICMFPTIIENSHVTGLNIDITNAARIDGSTLGEYGDATAIAGGLIGYTGEDVGFTQGSYGVTTSGVKGVIKARANENLLPVYVGGLIGYDDAPAVDTTYCYCRIDMTSLYDNKNPKLIYANLFGALKDPTDVYQNIFNNWDYIAALPEADGYAGEKMSTFAIVGELNNAPAADLSYNWGITKNIMEAKVEGYPLNYVPCIEKTHAADFYDDWQVVSYVSPHLTQDADTAQVTFTENSGGGTWPMDAEIRSRQNGTVWSFVKRIIVLDAGYIIISSADLGGSIMPLGAVSLPAGDNQAYAITPHAGYAIADVYVDGVSASAISQYAFDNVSANHTIHATFMRIPVPRPIKAGSRLRHRRYRCPPCCVISCANVSPNCIWNSRRTCTSCSRPHA